MGNIQERRESGGAYVPWPTWFFNKRDPVGVCLAALVYVFIAAIYLFTVAHAMGSGLAQGDAGDVINAVLLTGVVAMAVFSHFQCMTTNPGFLPLNYEALDETNLPRRFFKLLREREQMHQSVTVRKMLRAGRSDAEAEAESKRMSHHDLLQILDKVRVRAEAHGCLEQFRHQ